MWSKREDTGKELYESNKGVTTGLEKVRLSGAPFSRLLRDDQALNQPDRQEPQPVSGLELVNRRDLPIHIFPL